MADAFLAAVDKCRKILTGSTEPDAFEDRKLQKWWRETAEKAAMEGRLRLDVLVASEKEKSARTIKVLEELAEAGIVIDLFSLVCEDDDIAPMPTSRDIIRSLDASLLRRSRKVIETVGCSDCQSRWTAAYPQIIASLREATTHLDQGELSLATISTHVALQILTAALSHVYTGAHGLRKKKKFNDAFRPMPTSDQHKLTNNEHHNKFKSMMSEVKRIITCPTVFRLLLRVQVDESLLSRVPPQERAAFKTNLQWHMDHIRVRGRECLLQLPKGESILKAPSQQYDAVRNLGSVTHCTKRLVRGDTTAFTELFDQIIRNDPFLAEKALTIINGALADGPETFELAAKLYEAHFRCESVYTLGLRVAGSAKDGQLASNNPATHLILASAIYRGLPPSLICTGLLSDDALALYNNIPIATPKPQPSQPVLAAAPSHAHAAPTAPPPHVVGPPAQAPATVQLTPAQPRSTQRHVTTISIDPDLDAQPSKGAKKDKKKKKEKKEKKEKPDELERAVKKKN